ncbi:MAG: ABC transporter ATP-binding protein [Desulfobacterota bacterium]|nr:ABC transporter ATP-binding protein [Thermodesulfobacteriota bacterium]MDW8002237.1 ABC transporter ATP-binding protein [Deltaproteobacteria bacterium]
MIEAENLTKTYGRISALNGVSFRIRSGEIYGLLGPNGAGKTTIIKILTTVSKPDYGRATIFGFDVVKSPEKVKSLISCVPQENNLDRELTVYENLLIYGMLHKVKNLKAKVEEALERFDLKERKNDHVSQLSGGMQRRLLLIRALISDPKILFLDEPTTGLDPQIRRQIWDLIRRAKLEGRTVILTTHYIEEADTLCDRVGILNRGRLIAEGSPWELKRTVGNFVLEKLDGDGRLIQQIFRTEEEAYANAKKLGPPFTVRQSNLEDVFIKLTGERID